MTYKLGSLFDGSGGFPLSGTLCGVKPVWAAEVEPYPIAVTRSRFPNMKHLGDISKVNGAEIEPVDIITFGSPCQDLSVAGKRAGLKHEANGDDETTRSGLFMEAVRIIREMREATNGKYPTFALWENVPGAFTSNKGEDFRTVLDELINLVEPGAAMPDVPKAGWAYADSYRGDGWSLAYRVFDAQYWGVPQRRRRIHLVVDFRGERAREVLFEREGVRGYFAEGRTPRQATAGAAQGCAGAHGHEGGIGGGDGERGLDAVVYGKGTRPHSVEEAQKWSKVDTTNTLNAFDRGEIRANELIVTPTVYGIGSYHSNAWKSDNPKSGVYIADTSKTLDALNCGYPACNQGGIAIVAPVPYTLKIRSGCAVDSRGKAAGKGALIQTDKAATLSVTQDQYLFQPRPVYYIVRRLTPTECARLQGFADRWGDIDEKDSFTPEEYGFWLNVRNTHAAINGRAVKDYTEAQMLTWYNKLHTDSAEYKMWGNGIALPPALYCMQGIVDALESTEDDSWML